MSGQLQRIRIFYSTAPDYPSIRPVWKDCILDVNGKLNHRSDDKGVMPAAKALARDFGFNPDNVSAKTMHRMPMSSAKLTKEAAAATVVSMSDPNGRLPFDHNSEVLVFIPELLGKIGDSSKPAVPPTAKSSNFASNLVAATTPNQVNAPSVKFDHQKYDEGAFREELAHNVQETWDRLWNDEDPNRTIVAQILHDVFFRWAFKGFKSRPMGILLYGPPGNGKTFLFDKYLTKLGLTLTNTNYAASRFQKGKVGEGEAAMVAEASKCKEDRTRLYLMFIDEIDSIGADRNKKSGESYKIDYCNTLLAIVGQPEYSNLIVVGATNYKENLDEALIRDGRLQNHYFLPSLDKDRRLALLCDKLGDTLVDLFQIKSVISPLQMSRIVKRKIQEDVEVLNYFQRNTINFTFAQFDRLRSEVDGVWRLFDQHNPDDANFARMFRELHKSSITKEQILKNMSEDLIMTAINVYISHNLRVCLRDAVEKVLGSNQPNLRFNRLVLSRDNTTPEVDNFNLEIKQFFEFHESYRSAVASPTGRMILNLKNSSLNVELSNNSIITSVTSPVHRSFNFPQTFFRANKLARMLEPVIAARNYGYVQIIDRETIDLEDEDRIFKLLKAKYEEAMALSKTDTASLLVINLSDIVGMITKIQQSARVSTRTENRQQKSKVKETADTKAKSRKVENVKNNSNEQVIMNSFEASYKQSLKDNEDTLNSYENQLQFNNDLVKNSMEKESTSERQEDTEEFTSRTARNRATRVNENESFLSKLMKRARKENTTTVGESKTESVNIEHIKSTEQERTYRREVSDIESQSKTAEMSTIDTKSHSTEFRQDSSETRSTSDLEFTSRKTHERNTTSTNENLTQRDTFRQEQSNDKSRTDQSIHEQITSDENEVSFGTRSSTAHEEKKERVTGINKSKLTTESLSTTDNIRDFDNYTNTKIRSETERTEHSEIDERANEVNNLKETQKQTTNSESKTESTNETKKKDDSTNISSSEKSGVSSKNTVDDSLGVGTSSSLSIGATEEIRGGGGARIWGGIKTDTDYLIPLPQFGGVSASSNIGGGVSGTVTNENSMNLNTSHKTNDSSTISSSLDTDLTVAKSKTELNQGTKSTDKTKATDESDTTSDSNKESKTKTIQDTKSTTNIHSTDDRSETGKTTEQLTSKLEDVTTRTEQFERTQKSVSDTKREEEFNDTRHTIRENVRDIKSIQESINTQESTSQINETVRDRIESRVKETGELEEFGTRQEKKYETSDRITKSERASTSHEERYGETMTASVEQRITKTFAETDKETETHKKTVGFRTEKEFREQELHSTESAQEQERGKQRSVETIENAVREKENVIRQLITKDTEKMKETSMSEEYRKRLNDVITSRNELLNQLRKEKDEIQRSNKENTTRNTEGSATTVGTTAERNKTDKERDENASAVVTQTSTEVEISQEMLRLKIIDVIGRFAGIASEYLNNFDLKRGPDVVFAIDNPLLGTVVEKTIQWGFLETPCPEDSLSVPQILFSDLYEEDFWSEVIEMGLLEHLRIILTPIEANSQIEISCPNFIYKTNRKNNTSMASQLATLELQGPLNSKNRPSLSFTDSMFRMFADRDKFCHITTLNLSGLELRFSNERDNINMSCSTLKSINLTLCHVGSGSAYPTGENTPVSLSLILQYFAGNLAVEAAFPQLLEFSFRNPCSDSAGGVAVWEVENYCLELFERLNFLDITKTRVVADAVEKLFGYGANSTSGNAAIGKKRIGFGETLSTLVLDGCTVDGELRIPSEEETSGGSGSSGSKMKVLDSVKNGLKLNCFNLKPVESARIVSFWANEASKRTGKTVQIL